jgi:hypothetical protein
LGGLAFLTRPGKERTFGFDTEDYDTTFWGAYLTHWFDAKKKSGLDLYYLGLARENSVYESGQAISTGIPPASAASAKRAHGTGMWKACCNSAALATMPSSHGRAAWTRDYSWKNAPWKPRLGLKFDVASGDRNPNDGRQESFDPLFFKSGYFNDASLLRPSNIIDVHPSLSFEPAPRLEVSGGVDVFWRYTSQDAIYDPPDSSRCHRRRIARAISARRWM